MASWKALGITKYEDYFYTDYWYRLNDELLIHNPEKRCFICQRTNKLLIHHVDYYRLGEEREGSDVFILCFACHELAHFIRIGFLSFRIPLKKKYLMRRVQFLRLKFLVRHNRAIASIQAFMNCLTGRNDV